MATILPTYEHLTQTVDKIKTYYNKKISTLKSDITKIQNEKANIASPQLTGVPTAPTAPPHTNSDQIATTAFVYNSLNYDTKVFTAVIDTTNENPETSITYTDDATGFAKKSADWDNAPIFKDIKPCVFKDGAVQYYLDKSDFTKKIDGNDAKLDGTDGDVMIEVPKFAYAIWQADNKMYVSVTNDPFKIANDTKYKYYAFIDKDNKEKDKFYIGAYKGSLTEDGTKLRSISGVKPVSNKTLAEFQTCAQANGKNYDITNYFGLVALQCLYIIKYGNLNGQAALGQGVTGRSDTATAENYGVINTGGIEDKGMYYGSTTNSGSSANFEEAKLGHVKFAGIEDFWGNIWEWVYGLTTDTNRNIITQAGSEIFTTASELDADKNGWVSKVSGTTESGFMGVEFTGSSSTRWSDYGHLYAGQILIFSGRWSNGTHAGPFNLDADNAASDRGVTVGARLYYL